MCSPARKFLVHGLIAVLLQGSARCAEALPEPNADTYRTVDAHLRRFDANKDASLQVAEVADAIQGAVKTHGPRGGKIVEQYVQGADSDRDGILTVTEWETFGQTLGAVSRVISETVHILMQDGARLATDIHRPSAGGRYPVILSRTPYGRDPSGKVPGQVYGGYAVVRQDMRGRFDSEGENLPFIGCGWAEYTDGVDTVAWLLDQPWCDGNIGTLGGSAGGITQNLLAGAAPEGLKCQYINVAAASLYHHAAYVGGALRESQVLKWLRGNEFSPEALRLYRDHPAYDAFWQDFDSTLRHARMNVPAVHVGGWFDTFALGTVESFRGRQHGGAEGARGKQKLVMGPWAHGGYRKDGEVGQLVYRTSRYPGQYRSDRLFACYLKQDNPAFEELAPVAYFVMGDLDAENAPGNEWRFVEDWPPPVTLEAWYLHPDGTLRVNAPDTPEAQRVFTFNPADPCPTKGGCNLVLPSGPMDQRPVEKRADVLTFSTPVLDEPLEITGHIQAELFVSSSAVDTDMSVRVCDVYPDGRSFLMAEGMQRLRFRESVTVPVPLVPGQACRVMVEVWPTSVIINRGHRLRVSVTSSNFPRFDRNPGTGKPWRDGDPCVSQTNTIYMSGETASCIQLPVMR